MAQIIRQIEKEDNASLSILIKNVFREFHIDKPGTVYTDPTTDKLYELFQEPGATYWVVEDNKQIVGGCGIYPTPGLPTNCVELVKFYLLKSYRGKGIGKSLLELTDKSAKKLGYTQLYLESFPELESAVSMYEKAGFNRIEKPLGNTGHHACSIWMIKELLTDKE